MECYLLFNFDCVHKLLYIHLQLWRVVPKLAGVCVMCSYKKYAMKEQIFHFVNETKKGRQTQKLLMLLTCLFVEPTLDNFLYPIKDLSTF